MKAIDRMIQRRRIDMAVPYLGPGKRVLDIGCADGALFRHLPHLTGGVGLDPDLDAPTAVHGNVLLKGFFPDDLPDDRPFDVITMLAVLEHIPADAQPALAQNCARYLRPGGHVIITVPEPAVDHILALLRAVRLIDGMSLEQHYGFEVASTLPTFQGAGLAMVKAKRFQFGLNNLFVFANPPA
jgi:SAM-dependent methyltransferase